MEFVEIAAEGAPGALFNPRTAPYTHAILPAFEIPLDLQHETSASLLALIGQGERRAEDELVNRHGKALLFLMRQRTGSRHVAEDVCQETWRILLEKFRRLGAAALDDADKLPAYIQVTALNVLLGLERKQVRRKTDTDSAILDELPAGDGDPVLDELSRRRLQAAVRELIEELRSGRDRAILVQYYIEERNKVDICRELQLEPRHFDRVAHRAKERLRKVAEHRIQTIKSLDLST